MFTLFMRQNLQCTSKPQEWASPSPACFKALNLLKASIGHACTPAIAKRPFTVCDIGCGTFFHARARAALWSGVGATRYTMVDPAAPIKGLLDTPLICADPLNPIEFQNTLRRHKQDSADLVVLWRTLPHYWGEGDPKSITALGRTICEMTDKGGRLLLLHTDDSALLAQISGVGKPANPNPESHRKGVGYWWCADTGKHARRFHWTSKGAKDKIPCEEQRLPWMELVRALDAWGFHADLTSWNAADLLECILARRTPMRDMESPRHAECDDLRRSLQPSDWAFLKLHRVTLAVR